MTSLPTAFQDSDLPLKHTIYVLVRTDISLAQQIVQAAHATAEAARSLYRSEHGIASLVLLAVLDKASLHQAQLQLQHKGIACELFHEPDFGMGDSALATQPVPDAMRKHFRSWPLWTAPQPASVLQEAA